MTFEDTILNYWQILFLAPLGFVSAKLFSLNAKVSVNETQIKILKETVENLCDKHDTTNNLLRELNGQFKLKFKAE